MSIRWRLALWYGALAAALITTVCGYAFVVHRRSQLQELDAMLASTAEHVASELHAAPTSADVHRIVEASLLLGAVTRTYGADGHPTAADSAAAEIPPIASETLRRLATEAADVGAGLATDVHLRHPLRGGFVTLGGSTRWRAFVIPLDAPPGYLATILPLARVEASIARFGWMMLIMVLVGSGAAVCIAWLLASRALRPVALLSDAAADIARSREFARRVPVGRRHDELGRLGDTFNSMLGSLEAAYLAQQRFVADASHELRAPLTTIQGNLELALDSRQTDAAPRHHALVEAAAETRRMSRLVADLLSLARADTGVVMRDEPVELDRVIMTVLGEARHHATGQRLAIREIVPVTVRGDGDQLKQLVLILIDNALRYTPAGGRIDVELKRLDGTLALVVRDSGIGISPEDLPHVFDRFYRADRARTRDPGGTGLGLSIAHWIAEMHGARITVESERGRGTTVSVRFDGERATN